MSHTTSLRKALTPEQFDAAMKELPGLSTLAVDLTRRVLVEGQEMFDVVKSSGRSRQMVHWWVKKVWDHAALQSSTQTRTLMLPPELVEVAMRMQERAMQQLPVAKPRSSGKTASATAPRKIVSKRASKRASKPTSADAAESAAT